MMKFSRLTEIMKGQLIRLQADNEIRYIITDSRNKILSNDAVFFAHRGPAHDGHVFLSELYDQGVRNFIIERQDDYSHFRDANFILVTSTISALQRLTAYHRSRFSPEVIGITGSNGKTIIKEWLLQLLSSRFRIAATPYSYNSQIGVPLSVWQLNEHHDLGIFEAGIRKAGEMDRLEKIIQPTLGIFTNIGPAHDEHFINRAEKLYEKLLLFKNCPKLIYCKDHKEIDEAVKSHNLNSKTLTWGQSKDADIQIVPKRNGTGILFQLLHQGETIEIELPVGDHASVENLMHCITCMLFLNYSWNEITERLNHIVPVAMRLEMKKGINGCYLLDDSYNNDLAGLKMALDFLYHQMQVKKKTVILSDVMQSATKADELYAEINDLLELHKVSRLIGIGPEISENASSFKLPAEFFSSTTDFLRDYDAQNFHEEIILIKGARTFAFEIIVNRLEEKIHSTRLEIDLRAITHNLNFFRSRVKRDTKMMVMVKAFAYGSGILEIANLLQYQKADYLGVAYTDEGVHLRQNGIHTPIMVMNPSPEGFNQLLQWDLEPEVFSLQQLNSLLNFLGGRRLKIHLKIDTGMSRLGFQEDELDKLTSILRSVDNLEIVSIFSHLAAADEAVYESFTRQQSKTFKKLTDYLCKNLNINPLRHLLNSAGIIRYPEYQFDMVRLGIGLYGVEPAGLMQGQLRHISTLKTVISQIREVPAGRTIGYGRKGKAMDKRKIATLAIGYGDGFSRFFSNGKGEVTVNGKRAPVIGNVCMDMTMIDITGIEASEGDDVEIFGENPTINEIAERIGTIPYEIFTGISERVKRIYLYH
jgi:alanine racemase